MYKLWWVTYPLWVRLIAQNLAYKNHSLNCCFCYYSKVKDGNLTSQSFLSLSVLPFLEISWLQPLWRQEAKGSCFSIGHHVFFYHLTSLLCHSALTCDECLFRSSQSISLPKRWLGSSQFAPGSFPWLPVSHQPHFLAFCEYLTVYHIWSCFSCHFTFCYYQPLWGQWILSVAQNLASK